MPLYRRLPKRGFTCRNSKKIVTVNLDRLNYFEDGAVVTIEALQEANIIKKVGDGVKVIATGELTKKLTVKVNAFSEGAKAKIEALGGTCEVI
jgi:large subunit ribosomal protein L15